MKIFVNNFRGFTNTFVELNDVNFLVGENSTGKTSILKIIKLLHSRDFWVVNDMNLDNYGLGYFNEITNDKNDNNSYFEIGYVDAIGEIGVKLKYISVDERPSISEISFLTPHLEITFRKTGKKLSYRYELKSIMKDEKIEEYYEKWVTSSIASSQSFVDYERKNKELGELPLFLDMHVEIFKIYNVNSFESLNFDPPYVNYVSFAPIRSTPKRVYGENDFKHNPDGSHIPYLLREKLAETGNSKKTETKRRFEKILNRFGSDSGLFESVSIRNFDKSISTPFELQISIGGKKLNFTNVGYGVSQILPLLSEVIIHPSNSIFAIQQPEVHLHPKGQAAFGDFVYKSFMEENKKFILETHSDYLIDRFRIRLNKNNSDKNPTAQILFFTKGNGGNEVDKIEIFKDGDISDGQPKGYRDFFIREQLDLLNI